MPKYRSWNGKIIETKTNSLLLGTEKVFFKQRPSIAKKISTD